MPGTFVSLVVNDTKLESIDVFNAYIQCRWPSKWEKPFIEIEPRALELLPNELKDKAGALPGGGMAGDETVERILGEFAAGRDRVDRRIDFLNGDFVTTTVDLV